MALGIQDFLNTVSLGNAVKIQSATGNHPIAIGANVLDVLTSPSIDLGVFFTSNQVLDSYQLRSAINSGAILATEGVVTLTASPTV